MNEHMTLETAVARLKNWTERMHAAEAAGDDGQQLIAARLVNAYTFLVADLQSRNNPILH